MITKKDIEKIPSTTGIYFFKIGRKPIYIGKAVNLHARLVSHLRNSVIDNKERAIVEQSNIITYKTTLSEFDALILEAQYIKKYRPKYNVAWKDDKSYLYIKITVADPYPKVLIVRAENDGTSLYFGPFNSNHIVRLLIREIRRVVPFCTQKKISTSACFYSKIGLCTPCPNTIEACKKNDNLEIYSSLKKKYHRNIKILISILNGKSNVVIRALGLELQTYSQKKDYEKAIIVRNKIELLQTLVSGRSFESYNVETDYIYETHVHDELKELLQSAFNVNDTVSDYRIECYDISNLSGSSATAAMVVFINSRSDKRQYRKFKIKTVHKISDFDMLKEVLSRRARRNDWPLPHLLVIDGGKPQLRAVSKVLDDFDAFSKIPMIGLAKHPDRVYSGQKPFKPVAFQHNSPLFRVLQAIRDESHRFAKKYHVLLRKEKLLL